MAALSEGTLKNRLKKHAWGIASLLAHHLPSVAGRAERNFKVPIHRLTSHPGLKRVLKGAGILTLNDLRYLNSRTPWDRLFESGKTHGVALNDFHAFSEKVGKRVEAIRKLAEEKQYPHDEVGNEEDYYG